MMPEMADALLAYRETAPENPHGLVWARPNGWPIDKAHDAQEFRDLQAAVGVPTPAAGLRWPRDAQTLPRRSSRSSASTRSRSPRSWGTRLTWSAAVT